MQDKWCSGEKCKFGSGILHAWENNPIAVFSYVNIFNFNIQVMTKPGLGQCKVSL